MTKQDEAEATVKVTFNLPVSLVRAAKHWAVDADQTLQDVVAAALVSYLKRKPVGGAK